MLRTRRSQLTDSRGDTAWSCLTHAEQALIDARGVFLATQDPNGLTAHLTRKWRATHPNRRQTDHG